MLLSIVPSAMRDLTSEFGMGSGMTPSLKSPVKIEYQVSKFDFAGKLAKSTLENFYLLE